MGARAAAGGFGDFAGSFSDVFEDIFGQMMGGGGAGQAQQPRPGPALQSELTLEEAFSGRSVEIKVPTPGGLRTPAMAPAPNPVPAPKLCPHCNGHGRVRATQGFFTVERTCSACRGTGKIVRHPCKACRGAGLVQKERTLNVDIPPGVEEGTKMRVSGEGAAGMNGGPNGDLYIFMSLAPHPLFQRDGHDLHCRAPISFVMAALGGAIEVPTLDGGRARVAIPERHPAGAAVPHPLQGHAGAALGPARRSLCRDRGRNPGQAEPAAEGFAARIRRPTQAGCQPEAEGFMARLKEFWSGEA